MPPQMSLRSFRRLQLRIRHEENTTDIDLIYAHRVHIPLQKRVLFDIQDLQELLRSLHSHFPRFSKHCQPEPFPEPSPPFPYHLHEMPVEFAMADSQFPFLVLSLYTHVIQPSSGGGSTFPLVTYSLV